MDRTTKIVLSVVGVVAALFICCICVALAAGMLLFNAQPRISIPNPPFESVVTPPPTLEVIRPTPRLPTPIPPRATASVTPEAGTEEPGPTGPAPAFTPGAEATGVTTETVKTLADEIVPVNNLLELAQRLENKSVISPTLTAPAAPLQAGERQQFFVMDEETNSANEIQATLQYVTDHVYFWVEDGIRFRQRALENLANTFEQKIYPTDREFFGSEWTPGVDGDPHLYIVYAQTLGGSVAGYFASGDEYPPAAVEYSNGHEMFLLSAEYVQLDEEFALSVLAHEFQHMIHWYTDRNEDTWMNEGFSELAAFLNGYTVGGSDWVYVQNPDVQLNDWATDPDERSPHYGASFLFLAYFLDRFGEEATKAVVANQANGMVSIDQILAQAGATDPQTGAALTADDVFADWVVASYLQDPGVEDGRYTYHNYTQAPHPSETETFSSCPLENETRAVKQYGVDYYRLTCQGDYILRFEGSVLSRLLPSDAYSGKYAFWSNKGDESDMTLTREFDLTNQSGPVTLSYRTWYDLETDYDYLYLEASTDGQTWQILKTPSGTDEDPSGNAYGWGYNAQSGGGPEWIEETVDLSQFAGQKVRLRFEYITDAAVNGEGFLLDDVSIPEIDYFTDFEADEGGWEADGFVRIQNALPQSYRVSVISAGRETKVQKFTLTGDNTLEVPVTIGGDVDEVILVVSGTTRFTRQETAYRFSLTPR